MTSRQLDHAAHRLGRKLWMLTPSDADAAFRKMFGNADNHRWNEFRLGRRYRRQCQINQARRNKRFGLLFGDFLDRREEEIMMQHTVATYFR